MTLWVYCFGDSRDFCTSDTECYVFCVKQCFMNIGHMDFNNL